MINEKEFIDYDQLKTLSNEELEREYYHLKHILESVKKDIVLLDDKMLDIKMTLKNRNIHYIKSEAEVLVKY